MEEVEGLRQEMKNSPRGADVAALRREVQAAEAKEAALREEARLAKSELATLQDKVCTRVSVQVMTTATVCVDVCWRVWFCPPPLLPPACADSLTVFGGLPSSLLLCLYGLL